ncbi:hypothetical protein Tco_1575852 [Tanacetum coccineum]
MENKHQRSGSTNCMEGGVIKELSPHICKISSWWNIDYSDVNSYEEWRVWLVSIRIQSKLKGVLEGVYYGLWWYMWNFRNKFLVLFIGVNSDEINSDGQEKIDSDGHDVKKEVDYSNKKVKSEFSPHKKEIDSDGQDVKKDVKDEIEIARDALIQQEIALITKEIELGLWSWDDLNSEGDVVEGVPGVGGDGSNYLKTVDRISKSDEVGYDDVVRGFKDVKSLSSKRISVCNIVSDNDDLVADGNNSKVYVADRMVSDPKKSKNVIVGEKKWQHKNLQLQLKKEKEKDKIANTGKAIADCPKVVFDVVESCDVSCGVKKAKSLLSKRRRVYNVVSDDDDTVVDDNKVYYVTPPDGVWTEYVSEGVTS